MSYSKISPLPWLLLLCGLLSFFSCNRKDFKNEQILKANKYVQLGEFEKAIQIYTKLAKVGFSPAYTSLGSMYFSGDGVPVDKKKAIELFEKAALGGDIVAVINLGHIYAYGNGLEKDCYKGLGLLKEASRAGHRRSSYLLGNIYSEGLCGEQDSKKAEYYYSLNIKQGGIEGDTGRAKMYQYGYGVTKDLEKAISYYNKAFVNGSPYAANSLARICLSRNKNSEDCFNLFEKSYELGSVIAGYNIAALAYTGAVIPQDCSKSLIWAKKTAKKGHVGSMRLIGRIHESGCLGVIDNDEAYKWFFKAAVLGDNYSKKRIENRF